MKFDPRIVSKAVVIGAALLPAGCGGADSGTSTLTSTGAESATVERADLSGVRFEVRRDPG